MVAEEEASHRNDEVEVKLACPESGNHKLIFLQRSVSREGLMSAVREQFGDVDVAFKDEDGDHIVVDTTRVLKVFLSSVPEGRKGKLFVSEAVAVGGKGKSGEELQRTRKGKDGKEGLQESNEGVSIENMRPQGADAAAVVPEKEVLYVMQLENKVQLLEEDKALLRGQVRELLSNVEAMRVANDDLRDRCDRLQEPDRLLSCSQDSTPIPTLFKEIGTQTEKAIKAECEKCTMSAKQQPLADPPVTGEKEKEEERKEKKEKERKEEECKEKERKKKERKEKARREEDPLHTYKNYEDLPKAELLKTFEEDTGLAKAHYGCTLSPQGDTLCTVNDRGTISLFDIETTKMLYTMRRTEGFKKKVPFLSSDISANGNLMAAAGEDGKVRIWHGSRKIWRQNVITTHTDKVYCCRFNPTGLKLATASVDKTARILDVQTEKVEYDLKEHTLAVFTCAFNSEGNILATGADDNTVRLWDCRDGKMTACLPESSTVWGVGFSQDGTQLITGSMGKEVVIRDLRKQEILKSIKTKGSVHSVHFIRNDKQFVSCGRDSAISVWSSSDFSLQSYTMNNGYAIYCSSYHEGKDMFLTCHRGSGTQLWRLPSP